MVSYQREQFQNFTWCARLTKHNGLQRIGISFKDDPELLSMIRQIKGACWSWSLRVWHIPDTVANRILFDIPGELDPVKSEQLDRFKDWLTSGRFSASTIKTYCEALRSFFIFFKDKPLDQIDNDDVLYYNLEYILKNKLSASYQNQIVNAVKLYFTTMTDTKLETDKICRPKTKTPAECAKQRGGENDTYCPS